jgi:hypothetical protein
MECNRELIGFRPGFRLLENEFLVLIKLVVFLFIYSEQALEEGCITQTIAQQR